MELPSKAGKVLTRGFCVVETDRRKRKNLFQEQEKGKKRKVKSGEDQITWHKVCAKPVEGWRPAGWLGGRTPSE